jgi:dihydroorotate dehydrogenase
LAPYGDYLAVNVSSPNTPGLRKLQDAGHLRDLLGALQAELSGAKPLLVKVAPDLTDEALGELLAVCVEHAVAGVIATNTTLDRAGISAGESDRAAEAGGLSGRPLADRARDVVAFVTRETRGALPVIGVGGILTADDAARMVDAGASLVQIYTGLIFRGPALVREINRRLAYRPTVGVAGVS